MTSPGPILASHQRNPKMSLHQSRPDKPLLHPQNLNRTFHYRFLRQCSNLQRRPLQPSPRHRTSYPKFTPPSITPIPSPDPPPPETTRPPQPGERRSSCTTPSYSTSSPCG